MKIGDRVRHTEKSVGAMYAVTQKRYAGRIGVIESLFEISRGRGYKVECANVKWLKRGNRGKEFIIHEEIRDLELAEECASSSL